MTIYLHPDPEKELVKAYRNAFNNAVEIFALSAYLRDWEIFEISQYCEAATLVVGKDFGITRKNALHKALEWKNLVGTKCHLYVADEINGFHPKILLWREVKNNDKQHFLIVGSSNLTVAGFDSNYEANVKIKISEVSYEKISYWIATILSFSRPVTQAWINQYQEQTRTDPPQPFIKSLTKNKITGLELPEFPGLAVALAQRREQVYEFDEIKDEFIRVVRECALNEITQKDFYDWLIDNWNGQTWKFQGSGVFRRDWQNTNWQLLCNALVNIIDCNTNERDGIVIANYNQLEDSNEVEARKSVLTEMLCHLFPNHYPLWNTPVVTLLKKKDVLKFAKARTVGEKYVTISNILRNALVENQNYPASNLAELDHIIWAYCKYMNWT